MADPERFDADPDPSFHADADPDPNPKNFKLGREKFFLHIFNYILQNLSKLVMCNFLSNNAGGVVRVEALNLRD